MKPRTQEQIERRRAVRRRCYLKHRESILAYAAKYRAENGEKIRASRANHNAAYVRAYRERHPEKTRAMAQAWKDANPERRKATQAAYLQKTLDRHRAHQQNRRARKRAAGGRLSADIAKRLYAIQKGRCACCGTQLGNGYDLDHIVPLALGGTNTDDNIQLLTTRCNRQKGARHPVEFMQSRGKLL